MTDRIAAVESFLIEIPRDVPYLGPLREGERVNRAGYVVRAGNRTLYPDQDRSVLVRITTADGLTRLGRDLRHRRAPARCAPSWTTCWRRCWKGATPPTPP